MKDAGDIDEFLSVVTHELRSPLTPMKAIAQLQRARLRRARAGERELDLDALDDALAGIERQVDRMAGLVNDLLEVSRAGRGTFQLASEPFDLAPLVRDVTEAYTRLVGGEGRHTLSVEAPDTLIVRGDADRIERVLMNVVGNAVKFSPRGGAVRVRLGSEDGRAVIEVTDEGIGVPEAELAIVGQAPFQRGSGPAGTFPGVGVGLYVARLSVEGHGGSLELRSEGEGKGTTARIELPIA